MVISEIRAQYRDENDLLRTVVKHIYEDYDLERKRWTLKKVKYRFDDTDVPSDTIEISVEHRHGWLIPPDWEFVTEEWVCTRQPVNSERRGHTYNHDGEVDIIR